MGPSEEWRAIGRARRASRIELRVRHCGRFGFPGGNQGLFTLVTWIGPRSLASTLRIELRDVAKLQLARSNDGLNGRCLQFV